MRDIALSEVVGSLSYALDITEGQPPGHALRSCMIGMRLAEEIGMPAADRSNLFYALLLKDAGCSANAERMAALFGADDQEAKRTSKLVDWSSPARALRLGAAHASRPRERIARLRAIRDEGDVTRGFMAARCERGAEIARMLYLTDSDRRRDPRARRALGRARRARRPARGGDPAARAASSASPRPPRSSTPTAGCAPSAASRASAAAAGSTPRSSTPCSAFCGDDAFWRALATPDVSAWEPGDRRLLADDARLDRITEAFARVIDAKSPYTARHSERVAEIAVGARRASSASTAPACATSAAPRSCTTSASSAISNRILDKPGRLDEDEFALIKAIRSTPCASSSAPSASPRWRRSPPPTTRSSTAPGYPFGLAADALDLPMRVLAVADIYEALTALRPYRGPMAPAEALP